MTAPDTMNLLHTMSDGARERRLIAWLAVGVLTALVAFFAFRAYLSPELLFHFGNALHC